MKRVGTQACSRATKEERERERILQTLRKVRERRPCDPHTSTRTWVDAELVHQAEHMLGEHLGLQEVQAVFGGTGGWEAAAGEQEGGRV